jgi:hypothetical protein
LSDPGNSGEDQDRCDGDEDIIETCDETKMLFINRWRCANSGYMHSKRFCGFVADGSGGDCRLKFCF